MFIHLTVLYTKIAVMVAHCAVKVETPPNVFVVTKTDFPIMAERSTSMTVFVISSFFV